MTEDERRHVVKLLRESSDGLLALVGPMTDAQWTYREQDGRWSVCEIVEHLGVVERNLFNQVQGRSRSLPTQIGGKLPPGRPNSSSDCCWTGAKPARHPSPLGQPGRSYARTPWRVIAPGVQRRSPLRWRPRVPWLNIHETTTAPSMGRSTRISGSTTFRSTTCVTTSRSPRLHRVQVSRLSGLRHSARHGGRLATPSPCAYDEHSGEMSPFPMDP